MMQRVLILAGLVLLVCFCPLYAQPLVITSNTAITAGMSLDFVVIRGQETTVTMTGGTISDLIMMDNAVFNMSGGTVTTIKQYDTASVTISDASVVANSYPAGSSHLTITGFAGTSPNIMAHEMSVITISCGNFNSMLVLLDSTVLCVTDGVIPGIMSQGKNSIYITGGMIGSLQFSTGSSRVFISGGNIDDLLYATMEPQQEMDMVHIYGANLTAVPYGNTPSDPGTVTGKWLNGSPFSIDISAGIYPGGGIYNKLVLHEGEQPPAPCYALPATDLNGDCVVDMQDLAYMASHWLETGKQP